jgi:hypothetical protein
MTFPFPPVFDPHVALHHPDNTLALVRAFESTTNPMLQTVIFAKMTEMSFADAREFLAKDAQEANDRKILGAEAQLTRLKDELDAARTQLNNLLIEREHLAQRIWRELEGVQAAKRLPVILKVLEEALARVNEAK